MQEFLASLGPHSDPNYQPPSAATVQGIQSDWITNQFPIGSGVNPAADANWQRMIDVQKTAQSTPGAPDLTSLYQPGNFGTPPPSPTIQGATQTANQYLMENQQPARSIVERLFPASTPASTVRPFGEGYDATGIVEGGFDPTSGDPFRLGSPVSMQASYDDAMLGTGGNAINFYEDLMAMGQGGAAEDFRIAYREENGVDPARMADMQGALGVADARHGDFYDNLNPVEQARYDQFAALQPGIDTATLTKDFQAVEVFLKTLPSEEQRAEQDKANVTQADVDAYLKELDAMSDEDYNQIVDNLGLSSKLYKGTDAGADAVVLSKEGETGSGLGFGGTKMEGGPDATTVFKDDMDRIVAEVAAAKSACLLDGGTWGVNGCEPGDDDDEEEGEEGEEGGFEGGGGRRRGYGHEQVDDEIVRVFGDLTTVHQDSEIRRRMAELGTTDLTQTIRDEFATITTPDYAADILTAYESKRTAVSDAATARSEQLEAATTRAEGRIAEIKSTLTGELAAFEVDRVEQQTTLNQKVIDRATDMELALTERLTDIRAELGDQVTDEFESVAALAGTLVSSQATSSQDAMARLGQIANMAAAARLAAPVELSAEALTALGDLEFQIENQIAQAKADTTAQINIEQASAILNETMRQGGFETEKQRALVEATLTETLRGTVYEDRVQEMMTEALLQEDQYVRQFTEAVDRSEAQAKLQNLFGTQEYERQLDMMNLTRTWQTADALQGRGWQTADTLQGRGWQTTDMTTTRGWQEADYAKALADDQAAALLNRGYQTDDYTKALADQRYDYDTALLDQRYDTEQQRQADVQSALAENAVGDDPLSQMKAMFPGVSDELYTTAMAIAQMPNMRESSTRWEKDDPRTGDKAAEFDGTVVDGGPGRADGKRYFVTEYGGLSDAEAYLRTLTEGRVVDPEFPERRSPALPAEDAAALRALVDMARRLIALRNQAQYNASGAQYGWAAGTQDPTAVMDAYLASQ
jgi:hypothetical protein